MKDIRIMAVSCGALRLIEHQSTSNMACLASISRDDTQHLMLEGC